MGDSLYIDMDIVLNEVKVKSTRGVDLIPQLVSSEKSCNLPEVTMKGRDEYRVYERSLSLMNAAEEAGYGWLMLIWIFNEMNAVVVRHY